VDLRFYIDPESSEPHIHEHRVDEAEVADVMAMPLEVRRGHDDSRIALGQTRAGRYLRVIYVPDPEPNSVFVVTAYDLSLREKQALKRRRRKRQ
jgi:hypothetical protein